MSSPSFYSDPHVQYLSGLLEEIGAGFLQIPRFQRPMVWSWDLRRELFRSVRDAIPFGAILVWRTNVEGINCYNHLGPHKLKPTPANMTKQYLLDGLQRLTTLYGALHAPDVENQHEEADDDDDTDETEDYRVFYDLARCDFTREEAFDGGPYLPLTLLFDSVGLLRYQRRLNGSLADTWIERSDELARAFREYKVPIIPITTDDLESATRTFQKVNSQGVRMSESHMVHALVSSSGLDLRKRMAELSAEFLFEIGWEDIESDTVLRCCKIALDLDAYRTEADKVSKGLTDRPGLIVDVYRGLRNAALFLRENCGVPSFVNVPYELQVVLLADAFRFNEQAALACSKLFEAWFWVTTYGETFAGMSGDTFRKALQDMREMTTTRSPVWSFRRPFREGAFQERFDFRRARAKAFVYQLARRQNEVFGNARGTAMLVDTGREAVTRLLPRETYHKVIQNPGNRFLLHPSEVIEFRARLYDDRLTEEEKKAHYLSDVNLEVLRLGQAVEFVEKRLMDIKEAERRFYTPMLVLFGQSANKEAILVRFGFVWHPERMLWIGHDRRMAFSEECVQDLDSQWLMRLVQENVPETDFVFHFTRAPDNMNGVCAEILGEIGLPTLRPYVRLATLQASL
jgi:hypothetical protein